MNPQPKNKPYRNPEYLRFIRSKPSLESDRHGTEFNPIEVCHQSMVDGGCMGGKPSDFYTIPLLKSEHQKQHRTGKIFGYTTTFIMRKILIYINEFFYRKSQGEKF